MEATAEKISIPGRAYPARSSHEVQATLQIDGPIATIIGPDGAILATCQTQKLDWDMPVGQAPRRVRTPDGAMFEASDNTLVDKLNARSFWHRLHGQERFGKPLIMFALACVVGVFLVWKFALPAMVSAAVHMTPDPVRTLIDRGSMTGFDRTPLVQDTTLSAERKAEIQTIFNTLLEHLPEDERDRPYQLHFRSTPAIGPNAFALPGGTIVITDQLARMFDDEDVIAGVLAHEIGHVTGDHGLRQLYRSLGVFVLVGLLAGDTGPILEDVLLEGGVLLSLSYSRHHERDADQSGLSLADAAGYDPAGLMKFFEWLPDSDDTDSGWSSTHPASGERIEAIKDYLANR